MTERWSAEKAWEWYKGIPQTIGVNFIPSTAVNSTEQWMNGTFDMETMTRELGWAADFGFNSLRVFLPYVVWEAEGDLFIRNFGRFLDLAERFGMSVLPILFDDVFLDETLEPFYGKQPDPVPGRHNHRWCPCPGPRLQNDPAAQEKLRAYVHAVVGAYREDRRILAWEVCNEPGFKDKAEKNLPFMTRAFGWVRECDPTQPVTACVWNFGDAFAEMSRAMPDLSDVVSFHAYQKPEGLRKFIDLLKKEGRPLMLTEWMHRRDGSLVENNLPILLEEGIPSWCWGLVNGRTQTNLYWDVVDPDPPVWQHELLYRDGRVYDENERKLFRLAAGLPEQ